MLLDHLIFFLLFLKYNVLCVCLCEKERDCV